MVVIYPNWLFAWSYAIQADKSIDHCHDLDPGSRKSETRYFVRSQVQGRKAVA